MAGEDWVDVRLTAFAERYLKENGGGPLLIHDRAEFKFKSGEAQRVTRAGDWELVLSKVAIGGHALFEIVEGTARPAGAEEPKAESPATKKTQPRAAAVPTTSNGASSAKEK